MKRREMEIELATAAGRDEACGRHKAMPVFSAQDSPVARATVSSRNARGEVLILAVGLAIVAFYAWTVAPSQSDWGNIDAHGAYYNRLVDGLGDGQLSLALDAPPGLLALSDPYDPVANAVYRTQHHLHDTSLYRGKLYLYYGITPALVVFGPYHWLTGRYLFNKEAAFVFAAVGYLASVLLLWSLWRSCFPRVRPWIVGGCAAALGLANSMPALLRVPGICEVAIAGGYAFVMLACLFVWRALQDHGRGPLWIALASASYGLAIGARPPVLFGAVIVLLPVAAAWRDLSAVRRARWLAAAAAPLLLIGAGLALYNYARFGNIVEFGQRYQLAGDRQDNVRHFSATYLWFNFRLYFLQLIPWSGRFPFVQDFAVAPGPPEHLVESANGILANTPVALFAAGVALAWRRPTAAAFRWFVGGITAVFLTSAVVVCLFYLTVLRYQVDFHPTLVLLACLGVLVLENDARCAGTAMEASSGRQRDWAARGLWVAALVFSVAFSVFTSIKMLAEELNRQAVRLAETGDRPAAIAKLEAALGIKPDLVPAHNNLGVMQLDAGNFALAAKHFRNALAVNPASVDALGGLGRALAGLGQLAEAADAFGRAVAVQPDFVGAHANLAIILQAMGRWGDAIAHFDTAVALGYDPPASLRKAIERARAAMRQEPARPM